MRLADQEEAGMQTQHPQTDNRLTKEDRKILAVARELCRMQEEMSRSVYDRIYDLERRIARYERIFEGAFQEEVQKRLLSKDTGGCKEGGPCQPPEFRVMDALNGVS